MRTNSAFPKFGIKLNSTPKVRHVIKYNMPMKGVHFHAKRKYTTEIKQESVKKVIENKKTIAETAKRYYVDKSDITKRVAAYREHGIAGIEKQRISYTGEFKQTVVEDMHSNGLSLRETAAKYN